MGSYSLILFPSQEEMRSSILLPSSLLAMFLLSMVPSPTESTFPLINLIAAKVTLLASLKVLGISAGLLLAGKAQKKEGGTSYHVHQHYNRNKREADQADDSSLVTLTSNLEPEECFQLVFCSMAKEKVKTDKDVENIYKLVTNKSGKYKEARKFGKTGGPCSLRYQCSIKAEDIFNFYQQF